MLTVDMLKQNSALANLPDTALTAIAEMSKNDENTVIGNRIGALHGQYDNDIFGITGIKKNDGEKSYDYNKRILNSYKAKVDKANEIKNELEQAKIKIVELENKTGDSTLRGQLNDAKAQVSQLQEQLKAKEADIATQKAKYQADLTNTHVDYAFKAATAGLKFKSGITEPIQKTLLEAAKAEILAKGTPEFIDNNGTRTLVIRNANGNIINNPKNNLNPYTIAELVMETALKDVIDTGNRQTGAGTNDNANGKKDTALFDLSGVKNQIEADKAIENYLLSNGLTRDSAEFAEQSLQLRKENDVAGLPIR